MRILIVTQKVDSSDPILGFFVRWIEEFAKNFEFVTVICLQEGKHNLPQNVKVLSLGKEGGASRWKYLKRFFKYISQEKNNYDVVFVHMNQIYVVLGGLFWRMWGKKVGLWYMHKSVTLSLFVATWLTHHIFTASPESFKIASNKANFVGHGIDTELFSFKPHNRGSVLELLTVGRISPVKDLETIIDALLILHEKKITSHLRIVGDAQTESQHTYKKRVIDRAKYREVTSFVTWEGSQEHGRIPEILSDSDLFVHASRTGSLDKTVLEALAVGILPVTCDATLKRELPDDLKKFCIVETGNERSYANAILQLQTLTKESLGELQTKGRKYVEQRHSLGALIPKILSCYNRD